MWMWMRRKIKSRKGRGSSQKTSCSSTDYRRRSCIILHYLSVQASLIFGQLWEMLHNHGPATILFSLPELLQLEVALRTTADELSHFLLSLCRIFPVELLDVGGQ